MTDERPPIWEAAHLLRDAIYDTIEEYEVFELADFLAQLQDDGVVQAWVRAARIGETK